MLVRSQEHLELVKYLQIIETSQKTGVLTVTQKGQITRLFVQHGQIMSIEPLQGHGMLWNKLLQAGAISLRDLQVALDAVSVPYEEFVYMSSCSEVDMVLTLKRLKLASYEQLHDFVRKEAIKILQGLLTWSEMEFYFVEGIQSLRDRFPLTLRISSVLPPIPATDISNEDLISTIEEVDNSVTPFSPTIKRPRFDPQKEASTILPTTPIPETFEPPIPIPEAVVSASAADFILPLARDSTSSSVSPPRGSVVLQPETVEEKEEVAHLPDASTIETPPQRVTLPEVPIYIPSDGTLTIKRPRPFLPQHSIIQWSLIVFVAFLLTATLATEISKLVPSSQLFSNNARSNGPQLSYSPQQAGSSIIVPADQTYVDGIDIVNPGQAVVVTTNRPTFFGYALSDVTVTLTVQSSSLRAITKTKTDVFQRKTTTDSNGYWVYFLDDETIPSQSLPPGTYKLYRTLTDITGKSGSEVLIATFKVPAKLPTVSTIITVPVPSLREFDYLTVSLLIFSVVGILSLVYSIIKLQKVKK